MYTKFKIIILWKVLLIISSIFNTLLSVDGFKASFSNQCVSLVNQVRITKFQPNEKWKSLVIPARSKSSTINNGFVLQNFPNTLTIDPILTDIIQQYDLTISSLDTNEQHDNPSSGRTNIVATTSEGLAIWRKILTRGRIPVPSDFPNANVWPGNPSIYKCLMKTMNDIDLPRFVMKHPETVNAVLITVLRLISEFNQIKSENDNKEDVFNPSMDETIQDPYDLYEWENFDEIIGENDPFDMEQTIEKVIADGLIQRFGGVVRGVSVLDNLFGDNHGLLDLNDQPSGGFGLSDGIWQHTGWTVIPKILRQLESMNDLRELMRSIGKRPTSKDSNTINKFQPSFVNPQGMEAAQIDPSVRASVSGLIYSNKISDMLPAEAALLKSASVALRRLFMAKVLESKLLSYEMSDWQDVPSIPKPHKLRTPKPSAPGGPLILCLGTITTSLFWICISLFSQFVRKDTSWSMSGIKETLSKTVTLACVGAAHKQGRDCRIVAFSSSNGVMEAGKINADAEGIRRLLDFLSNSFAGGGTDVTGTLKYALSTIDAESLSAADLLLVTDGEIPDPPLSDDLLLELQSHTRRSGMQIHGLLVGRNESKPLSSFCTHVHNFLSGYEEKLLTNARISAHGFRSSAGGSSYSSPNSRFASQLRAIRPGKSSSIFSPIPRLFWGRQRSAPKQSIMLLKAKNFDEDEHLTKKKVKKQLSVAVVNGGLGLDNNNFLSSVEASVKDILLCVEKDLDSTSWNATDLEDEKNSPLSCQRYTADLNAAIVRVHSGLIEREEEAKLIVLALIAREHLLLLGPPGTAKSALGRRIATLCGGKFFQRLLTKFTTPEEIFGPLSLRALENDEYRRCTEGFLPEATVAFLDEIFKANSAILNTLLTILNERKFDNGAGNRQYCPIKCVIGASNEMPESEELEALYDRFLLRKDVNPVSDEGLMQLLSMPTTGDWRNDDNLTTKDNEVFGDGFDTVIKALSEAADMVEIGPDVCILIRDLRSFMRDKFNVEISDRRLVKASRLLSLCAASHGRRKVDNMDCLLLDHIVWRLPEQRKAVKDWLWQNLTPGGETPVVAVEPFQVILDGLCIEAVSALRKTSGDVTGGYGAKEADLLLIKSIASEINRIIAVMQERLKTLSRHAIILQQSFEHLWLSSDDALALQQQLLPKAELVSQRMRELLIVALALEKTLIDDTIEAGIRLSVFEELMNDSLQQDIKFTDDELAMGMKEAKAKYDGDKFRAWKRARKKASKD